MILTGKNRSTRRKNLFQCHTVHYKSHMEWPGMESEPLQYQAGNFSHTIFRDFRKSTNSWDFPRLRPFVLLATAFALIKTYGKNTPVTVQQDATIYSLFITVKPLYMFRAVSPPIIRSSCHCVHNIACRELAWTGTAGPIQSRSRQVAVTVLLTPYAVETVTCAPDDGWRYRPKHVERFYRYK